MERVNGSELIGANAYFTNFDNRIVASSANLEQLRHNAERTLKILLLTKNNVVCAASHLVNDVAYEIFESNPVLFRKQLVIPAFVENKKEIRELFESRKMKAEKRDRYVAFYESGITKTVLWNVQENSEWFRDAFVTGLRTENSVIRNNLSALSDIEIETIASEVEAHSRFSRNVIEDICRDYDPTTKRVLKNYRELMYHISGARVVNCESTLPQENYICYSLADIENRKILLSDTQVFLKLYLELLMETLNKPSIPESILDMLTFEDVSLLREPIQNSSFIKDYDALYRESFQALKKENIEDMLYSIGDLVALQQSLEAGFKEVFESELKHYLRDKVTGDVGSMMKNTFDIAMNFVPGGAIPSILAGMKSLFINLNCVFSDSAAINDYHRYTERKSLQLKKFILNNDISDRSAFLEIFELFMNTISRKYTI